MTLRYLSVECQTLEPKPFAAVGAFNLIGENTDTTVPESALFPFLQFRLHHIENCRIDDGFVVSLHIILRDFTLILFRLLIQEIYCEFLLEKDISLVFSVGKHPAHRLLVPHSFPARCPNSAPSKLRRNGMGRNPFKE